MRYRTGEISRTKTGAIGSGGVARALAALVVSLIVATGAIAQERPADLPGGTELVGPSPSAPGLTNPLGLPTPAAKPAGAAAPTGLPQIPDLTNRANFSSALQI